MISNNSPTKRPAELLGKDHNSDAFRQCLRRTEKLIRENKFDEDETQLIAAANSTRTIQY